MGLGRNECLVTSTEVYQSARSRIDDRGMPRGVFKKAGVKVGEFSGRNEVLKG